MKQFLILMSFLLNTYQFQLFTTEKKQRITTSQDQATNWTSLRILYEFVDVDENYLSVIDQWLQIAQTFLGKHFLIRQSYSYWQLPNSSIESFANQGYSLSEDYLNKTYDTDLLFFVYTFDNSSSTMMAGCLPIYVDSYTSRPVIGVITINIAYINLDQITNSYFESKLAVIMHEMFHGLGFSSNFFASMYDSVTNETYTYINTTEDGISYVQTPRALAYAQKFFSCDSINGLPMEQQGGSGTVSSHWERAVFYNEIMTGSDMVDHFLITDFTLQFLQDTGFYRLTSYQPDILTWGENRGCDFFNKQCDGGTFSEFCDTAGTEGCAITHAGIGQCYGDQLSNSCKYYYISSNFECRDADTEGYSVNNSTYQYFGYDSMCIQGSFSQDSTSQTFSCYQYSCTDDNQLSLIINGQIINCTDSVSLTLSGYSGSIICPENTTQLCENRDECPNQCNKKGLCMKGICTCYGQYYGNQCQYEGCTGFRNGSNCVTTCPDGYLSNSNINYCIGCPGNCQTCESYSNCTVCNSGYQLRGGFCDILAYPIYNLNYILAITFYYMLNY